MPGFSEVVAILIKANAHSMAVELQEAGLCSLDDIKNNEHLLKQIVKDIPLQRLLLGLPESEAPVVQDMIEQFDEHRHKRTDKTSLRCSSRKGATSTMP
jgi:hypothetical protein